MEAFAWMAWTWQTATFFAFIVALLISMALWERASPSGERLGVLRISTTRGDRLFISLLGSAFIHLAWLGLIGPDVPLYWASLISLVYAAGVFRWV
jgi:predicted small integral membrane protein